MSVSTAPIPPSDRAENPLQWIRQNFFSNWFSSLMTIVIGKIAFSIGSGLWQWATTTARWDILSANLPLYFAGRFPQAEYWRLWLILSLISGLAGITWGNSWHRGQAERLDLKLPPPESPWAVSPAILLGLGLAMILAIVPGQLVEGVSFGLGVWAGRVLLLGKLGTLVLGVMLGRVFCPSLKDLGSWSLAVLWGLGALIAVVLQAGMGLIAFEVSLLLGVTWVWFRPQVPSWIGVLTLLGLGVGGLVTVLPPVPLAYRGALIGEVGLFLAGVGFGAVCARFQWGRWLPLTWFISFWVGLWLLRGGFGLTIVSTNDWSGLLLTIFLSVISIALCFPLGVILALGRQSNLLALRWLSIFHIEVIRGVPLISILFMGQVMIPLFLPEGMRPDRILRAIVGLTLFSAVYMAENIRGGLQSIPKGQVEAAHALGLNSPLTVALIVLPQALKVSIPAIIGQFISLLQDTTLLSIVGLLELLGLSRAILANPDFVGRNGETYLFIGVLYWFLCYAMSLGGRKLEASLSREHR